MNRLDFAAGSSPFQGYYPGTEKLLGAGRASEGSASEPSLARRVSICKDAG